MCSCLWCVVALGVKLPLVCHWLRVIFNYVYSKEVDEENAKEVDEENDGIDGDVPGTQIIVVFHVYSL